ncbi:MAG: hypothetical protein ACOX3S_15670 [Anaerolineae bacterium]|jgi:hypothetical protein
MIPDGALTFTLWGLPGLVLVMGIMQLIKRVWPELKDRRTVLASMGVSVLLAGVAQLYQVATGATEPVLVQVLDTVGAGVVVGLGAGGFWSLVKPRPPGAELAEAAEE